VTYLQEHPECVAVFGDGYRVENDVQTDQRFIDERRRRLFSSQDPVPEMLEGALPVFSTGLIRRQALLAIGGFDDRTFRYYEDLDTPVLLSLQGKFGFVDAPVICRRQHETNVSSSTSTFASKGAFFSETAFRAEYGRLSQASSSGRCAARCLPLADTWAGLAGDSREQEVFARLGLCLLISFAGI
jgi:GT2 family glycosyltransferase